MRITRRETLGALAALGLGTLPGLDGDAAANESKISDLPKDRPAAPGPYALVPLPFDPGKLRGLSERLLVSHHDNNYAGALTNLQRVEDQLAKSTNDTPGFLVAGLRERELSFTNSVIFHELYFGNLGGDGKAAGVIEREISNSFGGWRRFEESFRATAMSLAGGSGWTVLYYSFHRDALRISWAGNHTQSVAFSAPLLVLDMYEHAYALDYGADAKRYVDAFFANVDWEEVNRRHERARRAARVMKG